MLCAAIAVAVPSQSQAQDTPIKITNAKLNSINMGLDSAQYWVEKMKAGDSRRATRLTNDLEKLATRFNRIPKSDDEQYKYVQGRFAALASAIGEKSKQGQPKTVTTNQNSTSQKQPVAGRPHRNLFTINKQLDKMEAGLASGISNDPAANSKLQKQMEYAKELFKAVPVSRHPDFVSTKKRMDAMTAKLSANNPHSGDIQDPNKYLNEMRKKYLQTNELPRAQRAVDSRGLTSENVAYFVGGIKAFGADLDTDLPKIKAVAASTGTHSDLVSWLEKESITFVKEETEKLKKRVDNLVEGHLQHAAKLAGLDIEKSKYTFVTESVRKNNEGKFERALQTLELVKSLESAFGWDARWSSKNPELEKHIAAYRAKASQAAKVKKLPADIGDKSMTKIAKTTLAIEKYGVGEIERMIVNSKMVPRDRADTRFFNGKLETTIRKWDEFQVCTVEKEDGKLMVYFNTLKKFSRGPSTTPINEWILSVRFKSGEISPEALK